MKKFTTCLTVFILLLSCSIVFAGPFDGLVKKKSNPPAKKSGPPTEATIKKAHEQVKDLQAPPTYRTSFDVDGYSFTRVERNVFENESRRAIYELLTNYRMSVVFDNSKVKFTSTDNGYILSSVVIWGESPNRKSSEFSITFGEKVKWVNDKSDLKITSILFDGEEKL